MLNYLALIWAAKTPSPDKIPLAGDIQKIQERRYFSSRVELEAPRVRMLVKSTCRKGVTGWYWTEDDKYGFETSIPKRFLKYANLTITHYFNEVEINYTSAFTFIWGRATFRHRRILYEILIRRWLFGKRNLEEASRIEVLRWCQEQTVYKMNNRLTPQRFLSDTYGKDWHHHPQQEQLMSYYKWVMQSLIASGELRKLDGVSAYRLEAKAIQTLVEFDAEAKRFMENRIQQNRMGRLTTALVFVGIVQAIVTFVSVIK